MVGKRTWASNNDANYPNDSANARPRNNRKATKPAAAANTRERPRLFQFRDSDDTASSVLLDAQRREELKHRLLHSVDTENWEKFRKSKEELKSIKDKKIRKFYESQNEKLDDWLEVDAIVTAVSDDVLESFNPDPDDDGILENAGALQNIGEDIEAFLPEDDRERRRKSARHARWAININVIANVLLLAAKIGAVFVSDSLSLIASLVDSALDLLCTLIIWSTNKLVKWKATSLQAKFPVGRKRLEPLGILVFSIIMVISFIQILQESFTKLFLSKEHHVASLTPAAIGAMGATIVVKGIIWFVCMPIKSSQVQALAQDCKTDVFFNTLSLIFPALGIKLNIWWLDPLGAGLLSLFIIYDWGSTCFENVIRLSGTAADVRLTRKIVFVAYRFESLVKGFKHVQAYHAGDGIWVEVDVLMDPEEKLVRCHDVAETLQYCLEGLNEVDRAFVTVDYTSLGPTGHSTAI